MRTRAFGCKGFEVSELALGTWGLSGDAYGPVYHKEVDRVIDRAIEIGITLFDTADVYGKGEMEKKLAERFAAAGEPEEPEKRRRVVTKIGTSRDADPPQKKFDVETLRTAFDRSRERLGRDKLDVVLLHNPSVTVLAKRDATKFMQELVKKGELEIWGVSAGDREIAEHAIDAGAEVIEIPYNLLWSKELHRIADKVAASETAVMARSVLAHGLLAGHWQRHRVFFDHDHRSKRWNKDTLPYRVAQLDAMRTLVTGGVATLRAAALRFVLANTLVSSAVLGPRSVVQLDQLVREAAPEPPWLDDDALLDLPMRLEKVGIET
jgi:aryl-alcohol dehydrogenase-like predicted oxidoreductase